MNVDLSMFEAAEIARWREEKAKEAEQEARDQRLHKDAVMLSALYAERMFMIKGNLRPSDGWLEAAHAIVGELSPQVVEYIAGLHSGYKVDERWVEDADGPALSRGEA